MTPEGRIQREIEVVISKHGGIPLRLQSGLFYTPNGERIQIGLNGLPDLLALLPKGRAVFIEVKTPKGKVRDDQKRFITELNCLGHEAYICRSAQEAEEICMRD